MTTFGRELDIITGKNCLVLAVGKTVIESPMFDEVPFTSAISEQVSEGYSANIARRFNLSLTDLPCLILFRDIRSPEYVGVTLHGMSEGEIAQRMRQVFEAIQEAISAGKDPLSEVEHFQRSERLRKVGGAALDMLGKLVGKTFEAAVEALIGSVVK